MTSWQTKFFNVAVRLLIRRQSWGRDEQALARRARRFFGSPKPLQWLSTRGLRSIPVREEAVRGEWLESKQPENDGIIFYIHGGGFVSCSSKTHRPITATLARLTSFRVFSLDYRLAPEHRFPAALDDVETAYKWLLEQRSADKIALAGDSAGGNLLLGLLLRLRDAGISLPACAVCFSAWTDLEGTGESVRQNANRCAMFYPENIPQFAAAYLGETTQPSLYSSPVQASFENFPPMLFQVGSTEILLDDSCRIHQKIREHGGTSQLEIYDNVFHCWQMLNNFIPEARTALEQAAKFVRRHISPN